MRSHLFNGTLMKLLLLLPCLIAPLSMAQDHISDRPNFTGVWRLNIDKSVVEEGIQSMIVKIDHNDPVIKMEIEGVRRGQALKSSVMYIIDGKERPLGQRNARHTSKWEGRTLVTRIVYPDDDVVTINRNTLSEDGKTRILDTEQTSEKKYRGRKTRYVFEKQ